MTANMLSPNSIRRPQSPRRAASSNNPSSSRRNDFSRVHNSSTMEEDGSADQPSVRRRARGEMGTFGKAALACVSPGLIVDNKAVMCVDDSLDKGMAYTGKYVPPAAKRNFAACASHTNEAANRYGPVAKEAAVDFAMTAAEAYRQECKSDHNRGGDELFFTDPSATVPQEDQVNSLLAGVADSHIGSDSIFEEKKDELSSLADEESSVNLNSPHQHRTTKQRPKVAQQQQHQQQQQQQKQKQQQLPRHISMDRSEPAPRRTATRFPNTNDLMAKPESLTPPRVSRSTDRGGFEPTPKKNLRATRMELFHQTADPSSPETRLSRALQDLDRQDQMIESLKRQLQITQSELDDTVSKLDETKQTSQSRQFKATEMQARAIQERKRMEDRYQNEVAQTKLLQEIVSQLQVEISSLKMALRQQGKGPIVVKEPTLPGVEKNPSSASGRELMAMRAEIVELRSQLVEANAANIDGAGVSVKTLEELEKVKNKLQETEAELQAIKEKERNYQKLQEQLFMAEYAATDTKTKLEDDLKRASETEMELRTELNKTKASLQRLEREKSRKRLHSSADQGRSNKQLEAAKEEAAQLREQLKDEKISAQKDIEKLTNDLEEMKQKLTLATRDAAQLRTENRDEKRKAEEKNSMQNETIKTLQQQIHSKDEKMIAQVRQIAELNGLLSDKGVDSNAHLKQIASLTNDIKRLEANEASLEQELQLHKTLLKEEREASNRDTDDTQDKDQTRGLTDNSEVESSLRQEISDLKAHISQLEERPFSKDATTDVLLKEISDLKSKLRQAEARSREEKLRSEEERRISRENTTGHLKELERLKQERNETLAAKNEMEKELVELRKKLVVATESNVAAASARARDSVGSEVSSNVVRLRNEMAMARARLVSAREQTRHYDGDSISTMASHRHPTLPQAPPSPIGSHVSQGSSWAPPSVERMYSISAEQPDGPSMPDFQKQQSSLPRTATPSPASSVESNVAPQNDVAPQTVVLSPKMSEPVVTTAETIGHRDLRSRTQIANSFMTSKAPVSSKSDLQRKLEESKRRLEKADLKLESLLGSKTNQSGTYRPLKNVVVVGEGISEGVIDQVFSSPSGNIEITQRSYGDV
eukprot:scaffold26472_cov162-Cylindrotheca_fusiformis.AAC.5